jgi:SAM-dependent methyltransferase
MGEQQRGLRAILGNPLIFHLFNAALGDVAGRRRLVREFIRPTPGTRVLDIGCGTANMLPYLGAVDYVGFDPSAAYIDAARARYGERGTFVQSAVDDCAVEGPLALVLAIGVLHHLDDDKAAALFRLAHRLLTPGGRLVTVDGCYTTKQSRLARFMLAHDRGRNVRTREAYLALGEPVFGPIRSTILQDLLRMPYTHIVLECSKAYGGM